VTPPPELAALEQQMVQLQASSERFSFQLELGLGELFGQGIPLDLIFAGKGEASDSPAEASAVGGLFGEDQFQLRQVGGAEYTYKPQAAEVDGGRPWVRGTRTSKTGADGVLDPTGILENDQAGRQGTFTKLVELLGEALALEDVGPVTVDDQRVIEFNAMLDPAPYLAQLKAQSNGTGNPLDALEPPAVGGHKKPSKPTSPPSLELEAFIAPNGLPVRVRATFSLEGATVSLTVNTLAINVPVSVAVPPPAKTIDEEQLRRIERLHDERERAGALRACRREHGAEAVRCRAIARARGVGSSSSGTTLL
jgi:hypothetical protein